MKSIFRRNGFRDPAILMQKMSFTLAVNNDERKKPVRNCMTCVAWLENEQIGAKRYQLTERAWQLAFDGVA